jgi:hypothetical protein|nr:MAG TPA: HNHc nucleases endonuclease signature which [Caudoviricetes sp.]
MRIRLSEKNFKKLKKLVTERDQELKCVYEEILNIPFPYGDTEIHHVLPKGEGGDDVLENLITLDTWVHRTKFHRSMGHADPGWAAIARRYLESEAVKEWTSNHGEELKKIYATAKRSRIERTRKQCMPKKPAWQPF